MKITDGCASSTMSSYYQVDFPPRLSDWEVSLTTEQIVNRNIENEIIHIIDNRKIKVEIKQSNLEA